MLGIFYDLIHECVEVYMDDFTFYGDTFEEVLGNLEKDLIRYQETNLSLIHEKCWMFITKGVALGHAIFATGIKVHLPKI